MESYFSDVNGCTQGKAPVYTYSIYNFVYFFRIRLQVISFIVNQLQ